VPASRSSLFGTEGPPLFAHAAVRRPPARHWHQPLCRRFAMHPRGLPMGLLSATTSSEYADPRVRRTVKPSSRSLAGVLGEYDTSGRSMIPMTMPVRAR